VRTPKNWGGFSANKLWKYYKQNSLVIFAEKTSQKLVTALPIFRFSFPGRKGTRKGSALDPLKKLLERSFLRIFKNF